MDLVHVIQFPELKQSMVHPMVILFMAQKIMKDFLLMVVIMFLIWEGEMIKFPMQAAIQKIIPSL